jgi:glycosyltransferase involved in cell wall biosynthesis
VRVCYFGTYRANYARNQMMIDGLRSAGIEVVECHESLWHGVEDRVRIASGGWAYPAFWWRVFKTYLHLLKRHIRVKDYDILVVGYPGQYDVFLGRLLSWLRRKPLVWDVLNSMYLIVMERGLAGRHRLTAAVIRALEGLACRLPDRLILDSEEFVNWFQKTYQLCPSLFRMVPIGADERIFKSFTSAVDATSTSSDNIFRVLYYGSFIPNHGVEIIVEAARQLQQETDIRFELVGDGPEKSRATELARGYGLQNLTFIDWLEKPALALKIKKCNVCLGTFGDTLQASLTNNNKLYEAFVLSKPVITGISPATPKSLQHGKQLYFCERGNPQALASAILTLKNDPDLCKRLGDMGYRIFCEQFNVTHIGEIFAGYLRELIAT